MSRTATAAIVLALLAPRAGESQPPGASAASRIRDIEGVYKKQFKSGFVGSSADVDVEDIVEIVKYDETHIYIRAELKFYNGHTCGIYGIAGYESDAFVYRNSDPLPGEAPCTLSVSTTRTDLVVSDRVNDSATCRAFCGARGSLSDYHIERSRKRPIRYMTLLKNSREYAQAVKEFSSRP